jgi:AAA domain
MIGFEELVERTGARKSGREFVARCPCHKDDKPSLSLGRGDKGLLVLCRGGCATDDVLRHFGLMARDLFYADQPNGHANGDRPNITATYPYRDERGELLFEVCRKSNKTFPVRRPDGRGGWIWRLDKTRRLLYRLVELLADESDGVVFIPEGEKDVDALSSIGLVATTNPLGAGKWDDEYNEHLRGRHVCILPDADAPGRKHASSVARSVASVAATVKILELPVQDVSDWLAAGHGRDELLTLYDKTPEWKPTGPTSDVTSKTADRVQIFTATELLTKSFPNLREIIPGVLPEGATILAGPPKSGKSRAGLGMGVALATGGYVFGSIRVEPTDVLFLGLEDGEPRLQRNIRQIASGQTGLERFQYSVHWPRLDEGGLGDLTEWLDKHPRGIIFGDTLKRLRPKEAGNGRLYDLDYDAVSSACDLIHAYPGAGIVLHHHTRKGVGDPLELISGTYGLSGGVDNVMVLQKPRGQNDATLSVIGRDLEDKAYALTFDPEIGTWRLIGDAVEVRISHERHDVLEEFKRAFPAPLGATQIARMVKKSEGAVRQQIYHLCDDGLIKGASYGKYVYIPTTTTTTTDIDSSGTGGTGGTGESSRSSRSSTTRSDSRGGVGRRSTGRSQGPAKIADQTAGPASPRRPRPSGTMV